MKKYIFISITQFFLLSSCTDRKEGPSEINDKKDQRSTIPISDSIGSDRPSTEFIRLIKFIDSSGYHGDTAGPYLKTEIEGLLFYKMKLEETPLYLHRDPTSLVKGADYCALNISPFKNCKNIWVFSFSKKGAEEKDRFTPSIGGCIEEFDLPDRSSATIALKEIDRKKSLVFYHTHSFCCSLDNSVFVFNTVQGGFDAALKEFFDRFTQNKDVKIPHNIPCFEDDIK